MPIRTTIAMLVTTLALPVAAQDLKPDPADAEAVRARLKEATTALGSMDARSFVDCCDPYVECFFVEGTRVKGKATIEDTLGQYFARRPKGLAIQLRPIPRSFRVLSKDIITVDWPAEIFEGTKSVTVNTLTTLRKVNGRWLITSYLESVPYEGPLGGRNREP